MKLSADHVTCLRGSTSLKKQQVFMIETDWFIRELMIECQEAAGDLFGKDIETGLDIFMLVEKDFPLTRGLPMLMLGRLMVFKCSGVYTSAIWIEVGMYYNCVERAITTAASLEAAQDSDNIIRTQTTSMPNVDILQGMDTSGSPRRQDTMGGAPTQTRSERVLEKPNEPPLSEGHTSGSGEGRMEHQFELMANVPITPHDSPLPGGYTSGSGEGRLKL
ncbi:hypothetical protein Tco_0331693 [Tanacetum coccineum]